MLCNTVWSKDTPYICGLLKFFPSIRRRYHTGYTQAGLPFTDGTFKHALELIVDPSYEQSLMDIPAQSTKAMCHEWGPIEACYC